MCTLFFFLVGNDLLKDTASLLIFVVLEKSMMTSLDDDFAASGDGELLIYITYVYIFGDIYSLITALKSL